MDSDKQHEMYTEFEPEANEIMFGQRTLPDRPLTDKELSKRKKIIMKLLDQKLKFELIELMRKQQEQTNTSNNSSSISTIGEINVFDSNMVENSTIPLAMPSNYQYAQNFQSDCYPGPEYILQNWQPQFDNSWQPQFENRWQPPMYPEPYQMNANTEWSNQAYNFQPNFQNVQFHQKRIKKPTVRIQPNNLNVRPSTLVKIGSKNICASNATALATSNTSTKSPVDNKKNKTSDQESSSSVSVIQIIQKTPIMSSSHQESHPASINQSNHSIAQKQPSSSEPKSSKSISEPMKNNRQFFKDDPLDTYKDWIQPENDPICEQLSVLPTSINLEEVKQSIDFEVIDDKAFTIDLTLGSPSKQTMTRKRQNSCPSEDVLTKLLRIEPKTVGMEGVPDIISDKAVSEDKTKADTITQCKINNICASKIGTTTDNNNNMSTVDDRKASTKSLSRASWASSKTNVGTKGNNMMVGTNTDNKQSSRNISTEWNKMNQLVTIICQNEFNFSDPLTPSELKLKNEILIQVSIDPNAIRFANKVVSQMLVGQKLEKFINECHILLGKVSRSAPEMKNYFTESRNKLIADVKALNAQCKISNEGLKHQLAKNKIMNIMKPFLYPGEQNQGLIARLIKNPYVLQDNEVIKKRMAEKNQSLHDTMSRIKAISDSIIEARPPKPFFMPLTRYVDVPFVVKLYDKSGKMTLEYATELRGILFDSIKCLKVNPKPRIRGVKFNDGSLIIVCINRMSFDWLEKTISNHLGVEILPVKKVILKNQLKTVGLKFKNSQYFHFNDLMDILKLDNPALLTHRWELRSPQRKIDSTKCVFVGVDVDSLIVLEEMNRVARFRKSEVSFEISYDDNEENFELMNIVKMKKTKKRKPVL